MIEGMQPLISPHFNLTVEMPLKAIVRGYSFAVVPISWTNRQAGVSKLKLKEMGSRYLFIVLYLWLEKHLARGDYHRRNSVERSRVKPNIMHDHVLITGGAGFVGSTPGHRPSTAVSRACAVIAFDNLRRRGSEMNLPRLAARGRRIRARRCALRRGSDAVSGQTPDLIIECSAEPSAQAGYGGSPEYLIHTNLDGLLPLPGVCARQPRRISCSSPPAGSIRWRR